MNGVFPVMTEHELLRELDNCAEYCTLSNFSVNSGGNEINYNNYNAPKYRVKIVKIIKILSFLTIHLEE